MWCRSCTSMWPFHQLFDCGKPSMRESAPSWLSDIFSRVSSSLKSLLNLNISFKVGYSEPSSNLSWNSWSSTFLSANFSSSDCMISFVRWWTTSWKNSAISSFALNFRASVALSYFCWKKVEGNMLGNNLKTNGSANSAKGTIKKNEKGINLRQSEVVRTSSCRSRTLRGWPKATRFIKKEEARRSAPISLKPVTTHCTKCLTASRMCSYHSKTTRGFLINAQVKEPVWKTTFLVI
mmetsp:Transcript_178626/g.572617  ORF Transcript_178626/g.572617 Transcript_178626/m.572617 type:complete len:236 (-) Transcript_178626:674-1381(-)